MPYLYGRTTDHGTGNSPSGSVVHPLDRAHAPHAHISRFEGSRYRVRLGRTLAYMRAGNSSFHFGRSMVDRPRICSHGSHQGPHSCIASWGLPAIAWSTRMAEQILRHRSGSERCPLNRRSHDGPIPFWNADRGWAEIVFPTSV